MADDDPELAGGKQDGKFQPGQSGNPSGRPRGSLNAATRLAQALMAGDIEEIVGKVIDAAKAGDMVAAHLIVERLFPVPKASRYIARPAAAEDGRRSGHGIGRNRRRGGGRPLGAGGCRPLVALIEATVEAIKTHDHDRRIAALERFANDRRLKGRPLASFE